MRIRSAVLSLSVLLVSATGFGAGNILLKEVSAVTLESSGGSTTNGSEVAASTTFDNRSGGNGAQAFFANFELNGGFGSAPTASKTVDLYLVPAIDGTNYAEVDTTNHVLQAANFVGSFVILKSQTGAQRMVVMGVPLQALLYKAYLLNNSGQTLSATWTLKVVPVQQQYTLLILPDAPIEIAWRDERAA